MPDDPSPPVRLPPRRLLRILQIAGVCLMGVAAALFWQVRSLSQKQRTEAPVMVKVSEPDGLPVMGTVPPFSFTDQDGKTVTREDFLGLPSVVDFIFTTCPDVCPRLTGILKGLQDRLMQEGGGSEPRWRFLSFTVDPATDTPPVLAAYAQKFGADPRSWRFLTGEREATQTLMEKGFQVAFGEPQAGGTPSSLHYASLILVDPEGRIRGYYGSDGPSLEKLMKDLRTLLKDPRP